MTSGGRTGCRRWSEEAARHEALAKEVTDKGRTVTAAEAYVRAAIYYHHGKHLFSGHADQWRAADESVVRCYARARRSSMRRCSDSRSPCEGVEIPGWLRKPRGGARSSVAIRSPGLDACKEELHA